MFIKCGFQTFKSILCTLKPTQCGFQTFKSILCTLNPTHLTWICDFEQVIAKEFLNTMKIDVLKSYVLNTLFMF